MRKKDIAVWTMLSACLAVKGFSIGDGGKAGSFLRYGVGGRALGMGRAFVATSEDASSPALNPAGLMGATRMEMTSMYTNLFFDSRFTQFGFVFPRPFESSRNAVLRFLFGPNAAWGFNWIGLSMTGFEQRSKTGEWLGDFGVSENAFLLAWARDEVGDWGLFRYGINIKGVNQNFPGLASIPESGLRGSGRDWSWGMDAGVSFQPIHAPLFRVFSLKYLVPLRLAFTVQNALQPGWKTAISKEDRFPRIYRGGFSYRLVFKDWIPTSWNSVQQLVGDSQILGTVDWEWMNGSPTGTYFGLEGFVPLSENGFSLFPRFGLNNRTDGPTLGLGCSFPFASSARFQLDYVYGFHPYLPNDNRLFLTLKLGKDRGISFYKRKAEKAADTHTERTWLLRIVAEYPGTDSHLAARRIAGIEEDSLHIRRFYDLIGGIELANCLFHDAKALLKRDKQGNAKEKALDAIKEYSAFFNQHEENPLSDVDLMNYAESLILVDRQKDAVHVLDEVSSPTLRSHFLSGIAEKSMGNWEKAISSFKNVVNNAAVDARERMSEAALNPQSMVSLSYLGISESLLRKGENRDAMNWCNRLIQEFPDSLDSDYPQYPVFRDRNIVDDAQWLMGLCHIRMHQYEEGLTALLGTERFYPLYDYGQLVEKKASQFVELLEKKDWPTLDIMGDTLLKEYLQIH